jgi:processive 1,2-diacylglycerol beta-glucosyltransferase
MNRRTSAGVWAGTPVPAKRTRGVEVVANACASIAAYLSGPAQRDRTMRGVASGASPRILLLTSTLGSGHAAANRAIEAALLERAPAATVQTLDFWSLVDEGVAGAVRQAYLRLVQKRADLYDRLYQLDQRTWRHILVSDRAPPSALRAAFDLFGAACAESVDLKPGGNRYASDRLLFRLLCSSLLRRARTTPANSALVRLALVKWSWTRLARRLEAQVLSFRPDAIVATQMGPAALIASVKKRRGLDIPTIGVPTDFGVHDFWVQPGIDWYCVAHESVANLQRLESAQVLVSGIPLMPAFQAPPPVREARLRLGLDPDVPVLLVQGGGLGLGVDAVAERLLATTGKVQVVALIGRNAAAREALAAIAARYPARLRVWDWTERMEIFLCAADVVVGKPGGLTVAEALACGRPLLATRSLRGQEGFNVRFLERQGVGRLVSEGELAAQVQSLLSNREELGRIQHRAWALGRRDGATRIADLVLALAQSRIPHETLKAH